jgi:hypothetical protein
MEITEQSEMVEVKEYFHQYQRPGCPGSGFLFPSNEEGEIDEIELNETARDNLVLARETCIDTGVACLTYHYREPAEGICNCGRTLVLTDSWANTCKCGREYNGSGQELAPREQWGEETGESFG